MQVRPPATVAANEVTLAPPRALADGAHTIHLVGLLVLVARVLVLAAQEVDGFRDALGGALLAGPLAHEGALVVVVVIERRRQALSSAVRLLHVCARVSFVVLG